MGNTMSDLPDTAPLSDYLDPRGEEYRFVDPHVAQLYADALLTVLRLYRDCDNAVFVAAWARLDSKQRAALKQVLK